MVNLPLAVDDLMKIMAEKKDSLSLE